MVAKNGGTKIYTPYTATICTDYELSQFSDNVSYILDKTFYPEDVGSRFICHIGACLLDSTLSLPRRQCYSNYETQVNSLHTFSNPFTHFSIRYFNLMINNA